MACPPHPADRCELRKKPALGGGVRFALQCQACFRQIGGEVPVERVPHPARVRAWTRGRRPTSRRRAYEERLRRPDWKRIRRKVLERDRYLCQSCGGEATEVHHLTYLHLGAEKLSELAAFCSECNRAEREQRITAHVLGSEA